MSRKLTSDQVRQIRADHAKRKELRGKLYHNGIPTIKDWAEKLGVSVATVQRVVSGYTYKRL